MVPEILVIQHSTSVTAATQIFLMDSCSIYRVFPNRKSRTVHTCPLQAYQKYGPYQHHYTKCNLPLCGNNKHCQHGNTVL
jgi:hypothetical protein